jgi:hypothetical protein
MAFDVIVVATTFYAIFTFDIIVAFYIPLVSLVTSSPVTWRREDLWNFSVHQSRLRLSYLVLMFCLLSTVFLHADLFYNLQHHKFCKKRHSQISVKLGK